MPTKASTISVETERLTTRQVEHLPVWSEPPSADTTGVDASAHTSSAQPNSLLSIEVSPSRVKGTSGVIAARVDYTPACLSGTQLLDALVRAGEFAEATRLCNEKLLTAPDDITTLIWTKDASVVKNAEGRFEDALTLLASTHRLILATSGSLRGRCHNALGRTLAYLGRHYEALSEYDRAIYFHTDPVSIGQVLNNKGRLLTAAGAPAEAFQFFERALKADDLLLRAEVLESIACALEAEGRLTEASQAALESVRLVEGTDELLTWEESARTFNRLAGKVYAAARERE